MVIGTSCRDFVVKGHGYRLRSVRVNMIDRGIRSYFFHDHFKEKCFYTRFSIVLQAQVYSSKLPEYSIWHEVYTCIYTWVCPYSFAWNFPYYPFKWFKAALSSCYKCTGYTYIIFYIQNSKKSLISYVYMDIINEWHSNFPIGGKLTN